MNKSLLAVCAALVAAPLIGVVATPAPASAASNCGTYPPGRSFGMRISPDPRTNGAPVAVVIQKNTSVTLSARLFRNGKPCPQHPVKFYFRGPGATEYHYSQSPALTNDQGLASIDVKVINDFRWFADYNEDPKANRAISSTQGARTDGQSLVKYCVLTPKNSPRHCP